MTSLLIPSQRALEDLQVLIEACLESKMSLGQTLKEVRVELDCNLREAIDVTVREVSRLQKLGCKEADAIMAERENSITKMS